MEISEERLREIIREELIKHDRMKEVNDPVWNPPSYFPNPIRETPWIPDPPNIWVIPPIFSWDSTSNANFSKEQ